jgi:hypothetical protein
VTISAILTIAIACLAVALCVRACVSLGRGENEVAARSARRSMFAAGSFLLPVVFATLIVVAEISHGAESKATALAQGISQGMNAGVVDIPTGLVSFIIWILSKRRMSAGKT